MLYDIKEIVKLCLENDVNVEIFHGKNTSQQWRATAFIELGETIRVDFGDKAHGQRVSRIHVANNHRVVVKEAELINAITLYQNESKWGVSSATRPEQRLPVAYDTDGKGIKFEGTISQVDENPYVEDGEIYVRFMVEIRSWFLVKGEVNERKVTQTLVRFSPKGDETEIAVGKKVNVTGRYVPSFGIEAVEVTTR